MNIEQFPYGLRLISFDIYPLGLPIGATLAWSGAEANGDPTMALRIVNDTGAVMPSNVMYDLTCDHLRSLGYAVTLCKSTPSFGYSALATRSATYGQLLGENTRSIAADPDSYVASTLVAFTAMFRFAALEERLIGPIRLMASKVRGAQVWPDSADGCAMEVASDLNVLLDRADDLDEAEVYLGLMGDIITDSFTERDALAASLVTAQTSATAAQNRADLASTVATAGTLLTLASMTRGTGPSRGSSLDPLSAVPARVVDFRLAKTQVS